MSLWSPEAGKVAVQWIISLGNYDEPSCFVIERQVDDGPFEAATTLGNVLGWWDPTYFDNAAEITYRVYGANDTERSESGEATILIPAHTPFVTPSSSLRGDVDCDFDVDSADASLLLEGIAGLPAPGLSETCYLEPRPGEAFTLWHRYGRTDLDCDQYTSTSDVLVLLRFITELPLNIHRFCQASWPS